MNSKTIAKKAPKTAVEHSIEIHFEDLPKAQVKATADVPAELCASKYREAVKEINKEVTIPGFRKGKAPDNLIERDFQSAIQKAWHQLVANFVWVEMQKQAKREVLAQEKSEVRFDSLSKEGGKIHITFTAMPALIDELDLSEFKFTKPEPKPVTDEQVENELLMLRQMKAAYTTHDDRTAQENDRITFAMEGIDGDKSLSIFEKRKAVLGKQLAPWLNSSLIGKKVGDVMEVERPEDALEIEGLPAAFANLSKAINQTRHFRLTIEHIETPTLPEVDDAFAKQFGAESVEDLTAKIRERLAHESVNSPLDDAKDALSQYLLERYPLELPEKLWQQECMIAIHSLFNDLIARGYSEQWLERFIQELKLAADEKAASYIKLFLILKGVMNKHNIAITRDQLQLEMMRETYLLPHAMRVTVGDMDDQMKMNRVATRMLTEEALRKLLDETSK